jgi:hypothetical protein
MGYACIQCTYICRVLRVRVLSFDIRTAMDIPTARVLRGGHVPAPASLPVQGRHCDSS